MDVKSANQIAPADDLEILDQPVIAFAGRVRLLAPACQWMRAGGDQSHAEVGGNRLQAVAQRRQGDARRGCVAQDRRRNLHLRRLHFLLDAIAEATATFVEEPRRRGGHQIARFRIDEEEFLFDAERRLERSPVHAGTACTKHAARRLRRRREGGAAARSGRRAIRSALRRRNSRVITILPSDDDFSMAR